MEWCFVSIDKVITSLVNIDNVKYDCNIITGYIEKVLLNVVREGLNDLNNLIDLNVISKLLKSFIVSEYTTK